MKIPCLCVFVFERDAFVNVDLEMNWRASGSNEKACSVVYSQWDMPSSEVT